MKTFKEWIHQKMSHPYSLFQVPPITNTMSPDAWEAVLAGTVKTLTCRAGSAHPFGHMIWRNGSADIEDNINAVTEPGDFGGDILESTYTFTAQVSDNGQKISCTPGWTNDTAELIAYRREVKLNVTCECLYFFVFDFIF